MLAAEVDCFELMLAQSTPEPGFCFGLGVAQRVGMGKDLWIGAAVGHTPSLALPHFTEQNGGVIELNQKEFS